MSRTGIKTDNHDPTAKLDLRRHFLSRYHADIPPAVFDCCQGDGTLWGKLRAEFLVRSYWGVDLKPKKGRIKVDSVRVLECGGWDFDVIDADTYGSPWKHYAALLPRVRKPVTVFLTLGFGRQPEGSSVCRYSLEAIGLAPLWNISPITLFSKCHSLFPVACIARALDLGLRIVEATEAESHGNARYFGVRLEPDC